MRGKGFWKRFCGFSRLTDKTFSRGDFDENHILGNRNWQLLPRGDPNDGQGWRVSAPPFLSIRLHPPCIMVTANIFSVFSSSFFNVYLFILRERERGREWGRVRERERENPKQAPCCQHRPDVGLEPTNQEIRT